MEPRARVELATCRLRNERFSSISFVFDSAAFTVIHVLSPSFASQVCNALCNAFPCFASTKRDIGLCMKERLSTREAANKLGVALLTLQRHVSAKTVDAPLLQKVGGVSVPLWSDRDIEKARKFSLASNRGGNRKSSSQTAHIAEPTGRRYRETNDWKGLKGVRAGRVGGTDRAPNHINLSQGKAEIRGFLQCTHSHRQLKSASSCRILK